MHACELGVTVRGHGVMASRLAPALPFWKKGKLPKTVFAESENKHGFTPCTETNRQKRLFFFWAT